jgi:DNA-binding winged helix-turn-helix (wHTH) protein
MERDSVFNFGPFRLDARERVLLRDDRLVPLPPKALSTLLVLVRHTGHVLEKDFLLAEVWPDEIVEEGNLAQQIFLLRKALGETKGKHTYIETIPRRGYRFLGAVQTAVEVVKDHENAEANRAYVEGTHHWRRYTEQGLQQAIRCFSQTLQVDPDHTSSYAGLVDCYLRLATNYVPPPDEVRQSATIDGSSSDAIHDAERERRRVSELRLNHPTSSQWHVAYLFSANMYRMSRAGMELIKTEEASLLDSAPEDPVAHVRLSPNEEVQIFCLVAREQVEAGNAEAAYALLRRWWTFGDRPNLVGLSPESSADLLLTAGTVAGYVGSTRQIVRAQKHCAALLNGAIGICEQIGSRMLSAEGQIQLALCYQREGMFDLALPTTQAALKMISRDEHELRSWAHIRLATINWQIGRPQDALSQLYEAAEAVALGSPYLLACYHLELATALQSLAKPGAPDGYIDRALDHYQKAVDHYTAIGNHRLVAVAQNNLGYLKLAQGRLAEAEIHLLHARKFFHAFGDKRRCAHVDQSLAEFYIAAGQFALAEQTIVPSIENLETGGHEWLLAEGLRIHARALCKMGRTREAKRVLHRAQQVSERCGDLEGAGDALLMLIEEMCDQLDDDERGEVATRLNQLLSDSQKESTIVRLRMCLAMIAAQETHKAQSAQTGQ